MPFIPGGGGGPGGDPVEQSVNLRSGISADAENSLSSIISEYLPDFVRNNHSGFVDFVEAYYEWMEHKENPYATSITLMDTLNIDKTLDSFIDYFKETYLHNFPKTFATSGSNTVNQKTILKNINDFYKAKGTEKAYKFLFRILHDSDVDLFYPKVDILQTSDGKWIENQSIKVTSSNDNLNFSMRNKTIQQYQVSESGKITATAIVSDVYQYNVQQYNVTELFLKDVVGTFLQGSKIKCTLDDDSVIEEVIYSIPSVINILSGGVGYRLADQIEIDESSSQFISGAGAKGSISRVSETGEIKSAQIDNFGVNYVAVNNKDELPIVFRSSSGNAGASGTVSLDALCSYPGYYSNNDGMLSSNKKIRDNNYWQEYSYLLKAEVSLDAYKNQIKKLIHPAGTKMFGNISMLNSVASSSEYNFKIFQETQPILGRYMPYTLETHDDLNAATGYGGAAIDLYPDGFYPGATSANHCLGNTGGRISIINNVAEGVVGYTLGTFQNGDTFEQAAQGVTGEVFSWNRTSNTGGVLFLYTQGTGGAIGFQANSDLFEFKHSGVTGEITSVQIGNGTVLESGSYTHITGGFGLSAGATLYGATGHWEIGPSFQSLSDSIGLTMDVTAWTDMGHYTAGTDYTIGNLVTQGDSDYGSQSTGTVVEWITGVSGGTGGVLKIKHLRGAGFTLGPAIYEIDNYTGGRTGGGYTFGVKLPDEQVRNKIKHLKLEDTVKHLRYERFDSDD